MSDSWGMDPRFSRFDQSERTGDRYRQSFPDPFFDYATTQMPRSIYDVLWYSQFLMMANGTLRGAAERVIGYFLTDIEVENAGNDEEDLDKKYLKSDMRILYHLAAIGWDRFTYGNAFPYLQEPFMRFLVCEAPGCRLVRAIGDVDYTWAGNAFCFKCVSCGHTNQCKKPVDISTAESEPVQIIRANPFLIRIVSNPLTGKKRYYSEVTPRVKNDILQGNRFILETTPWEWVECVIKNTLFRFDDGALFHMHDPMPAGLSEMGWGAPPSMYNFRKAWYTQTLFRYSEAHALDYVLGPRVVTPEGPQAGRDPITEVVGLGGFANEFMRFKREHRLDPTAMAFFPVPIKMTTLGSDGRQMSPADLLEKGQADLLGDMGVPMELYRMSLTTQAAPVGLRLFERLHVGLVEDYNAFLNWLSKRVALLRKKRCRIAKLTSITMADNLERKSVMLQLAGAGKISDQTALGPYNLNVREETRRQLREQEFRQEASAKAQEQMQEKQQLQGAVTQPAQQQGQGDPNVQGGQGQPQQGGQGGDPNAQGGQPQPVSGQVPPGSTPTPDDVAAKAEELAPQILGMPPSQRRKPLADLKASNPPVYAQTKAKMDEIRQQAKSQGGSQVMASQFGPAAA